MSNASDRRAPGTSRVQFDAMVEVGGALGPSFEAQAVNLSEEGMSLRTAYLPEVGQPVMCRFDAGHGMSVVAAGEVLWKDDMGNGGEFGIRFTNLDSQSTVALQRVLGMAEDGDMAPQGHGRKVRLHIDGLASPMRARIRDQMTSGVTAYSELGFLQMGRPLELEDATSGNRRPALIDHVEVAIDGASRIPQLVVSLRYDDAEGRAAMAHAAVVVEDGGSTPQEAQPSHDHDSEMDGGEPYRGHDGHALNEHIERGSVAEARATGEEREEESNNIKSAFARNVAKVTPALLTWAKRAKIAAALLAARARRPNGDDTEIPMRRTTAPAPGGGLHAAGRKVVRGSVPDDRFEEEAPTEGRFKITKKKAAIASSIGIAAILVFFAIKKPAPAPQLASAPPTDTSTATNAPTPGLPGAPPTSKPTPPPNDPLTAAAMANAPHKATPFVNGNVGAHPNVIKIKMDGVIDGIQGAPQPTGFTVTIPNRKSIEPTSSLVEKDPRIAAVHVNSEVAGTEFSVTFKDGVPPYMVRAHGDTLEMVLAKTSAHGEAHAHKKKGKKH